MWTRHPIDTAAGVALGVLAAIGFVLAVGCGGPLVGAAGSSDGWGAGAGVEIGRAPREVPPPPNRPCIP